MKEIDLELVNQFYEQLDILEFDEVYLIFGGARKKYEPSLSKSHEIVTRNMIRSTFSSHHFVKAVLSTFEELKLSFDKDKKFPIHSLVTYITINPRNVIKAYFKLQDKMNIYLQEILNTNHQATKDNLFHQFSKLPIHFYSELQKEESANKKYSILDVDVKNEFMIKDLISQLEEYVKFVTETRGGYHIIYESQGNKVIYENNILNEYVDVDRFYDRLTPIWGTLQGSHLVKSYENY